jgi:hypothetical protein
MKSFFVVTLTFFSETRILDGQFPCLTDTNQEIHGIIQNALSCISGPCFLAPFSLK